MQKQQWRLPTNPSFATISQTGFVTFTDKEAAIAAGSITVSANVNGTVISKSIPIVNKPYVSALTLLEGATTIIGVLIYGKTQTFTLSQGVNTLELQIPAGNLLDLAPVKVY